jgi:N-acetylglutamate synthase
MGQEIRRNGLVDPHLIRSIERCSMNGLPALKTGEVGGWVLRFSEGYTNRANTVNPLELEDGLGDTNEIEDRLRRCEELYAGVGQPTIFKMTEAIRPENLEKVLVERGYRPHGPLVNMQTCELGPGEKGGAELIPGWGEDEEFRIVKEPQVSFLWFKAFARMNSLSISTMNILSRMLHRIEKMSMFVRIELFGSSVGCGYAVLEDGHLGLFDILVDERMRRQGIGELVMHELMEWGRNVGANMAYLQVVTDNEPALTLYRKLGFGTAYQYWYLKK